MGPWRSRRGPFFIPQTDNLGLTCFITFEITSQRFAKPTSSDAGFVVLQTDNLGQTYFITFVVRLGDPRPHGLSLVGADLRDALLLGK